MWANWLHNPCCLGVPEMEMESKMAIRPLPSWVETRGQVCYIMPSALGVPNIKTIHYHS